ncbi:MAG: leucine-rich repeat protein [Mycoplasma sp.]|nr:leucine-rich repeat protein [Mycoplasma sp.]
MKKFLKVGSAVTLVVAPLGVAVSCGNNDQHHKEAIKSIAAGDIFKYIKSDTNQLPSKVAKPSNFKMVVPHENKSHEVLASVSTWKANDDEGYIDYVIQLSIKDAKKEISGRLTDYITKQQNDDKTTIEQMVLGDMTNQLPTATDVLPNTIAEPSSLTNVKGADITIVEWDPMDSLGEIHYELRASKGGYSRTFNGVIIGYKTETQHAKESMELEKITHVSFDNFPVANSTLMSDDASIVWPDKQSLTLNPAFNPGQVISVQSITWDQKDKAEGKVHWTMELKHKNLAQARTISGTVAGFMTADQKAAKDLINGIDEKTFKSTITGLPIANSKKLPSEETKPTTLATSTAGINLTLKMWDPRDAHGEIEYEVEIEKLGFKKTFIYKINGFQITKDREEWDLLDSVHPESLLDFPAPDSWTLASTVAKPVLTSPVEGMTAEVLKWEANDYAGTISWTIKTTLNGKEKEVSGKIEGYYYSGWRYSSSNQTMPEGLKYLEAMYLRTIDGDLVIPDSVIELGVYFLNASTVKGNLVIPNNFTETSWAMLWGSRIEGTLDMSKNTLMKSISNQAFSRNYVNKLILPNSLETIGSMAFWDSTFNDFSIDNLVNLKSIGNRAFGLLTLPSDFKLPTQKVELSGDVFHLSTLPNGFKIPEAWDDVAQLKAAFATIVQKGKWMLNGVATQNNEPQPGAVYVYN